MPLTNFRTPTHGSVVKMPLIDFVRQSHRDAAITPNAGKMPLADSKTPSRGGVTFQIFVTYKHLIGKALGYGLDDRNNHFIHVHVK